MADWQIRRELATAAGDYRAELTVELATRKLARNRARQAAQQCGHLGGAPGGHRDATVPEV
jgi:hypothetical protein